MALEPAAVLTTTDTIVIGAGPAGLAAAACLRRHQVPCVLLEKATAVGAAWRNHYRRLHLHTVKQLSALPYLPFPAGAARYPSRVEVVDYLEGYARHHNLEPRLGEEVLSVERADGGASAGPCWHTRTSAGEYLSRHVVVASGHAQIPNRPRWPGEELFGGPIVHSVDYRSADPFAGKSVLVVGLGNTGGEIALDLHEHEARVAIAARSPVNVVPRDFLGNPIQRSAIVTGWLPVRARDWLGRSISRLVFGDLRPFGIRATGPGDGPASTFVKRNRTPLVDVGTVALVKAGALKVLPDVARFVPGGVRFADDSEAKFDAVVLATGYRPGFATFLPAARPLMERNPHPPCRGDLPELPGVFFLGFQTPGSGLLRLINRDARALARTVAVRRGTTARTGR